MEKQKAYAPEQPAESAEATPEATGEGEQSQQAEQVETEATTAEPEEKMVPLKAAQEERRKRQELLEETKWLRKVAMGEVENPFKPDITDKPKPDQYDDYDSYVEALADYKAQQAILKAQESTHKLTREQYAQREQQRLEQKAARDAAEASKRYPDFYEVASKVTLSKDALQEMYDSDLGPELAYYLGKNPSEMERISDLTPAKQIKELSKLEVKLTAKTATPERKVVKEPTKVESAGSGFQQPKNTLVTLRDKAQRSGSLADWGNYFAEMDRKGA